MRRVRVDALMNAVARWVQRELPPGVSVRWEGQQAPIPEPPYVSLSIKSWPEPKGANQVKTQNSLRDIEFQVGTVSTDDRLMLQCRDVFVTYEVQDGDDSSAAAAGLAAAWGAADMPGSATVVAGSRLRIEAEDGQALGQIKSQSPGELVPFMWAEVVAEEHISVRDAIVSIKPMTREPMGKNSAQAFAGALRSSLSVGSVRNAFSVDGFAFSKVGAIMPMSEKVGAQMESSAEFEVQFSMTVFVAEQVSSIEAVEFQGPSGLTQSVPE